VCVFYLALRALDTIEDDMAIPVSIKLPALATFAADMQNPEWRHRCGYGPYIRLMDEYPRVTRVLLRLEPRYRAVIVDVAGRMASGMAEFLEREVDTVDDWDRYCHYVAGLVGIGLSSLFALSGLEDASFGKDAGAEDPEATSSNHMGLFLQKTNIVRDYLEDVTEEPAPRMFWPRAVWGRYAKRRAGRWRARSADFGLAVPRPWSVPPPSALRSSTTWSRAAVTPLAPLAPARVSRP